MSQTRKDRKRIEALKRRVEEKKRIELREGSAAAAQRAKERILELATTKREYAEILAAGMTASERIFWDKLKAFKFPQWYAQAIVRGYIVDYYAPESRLAVELDGRFHQPDKDRVRDGHLAAAGIKTMRFKSKHVFDPRWVQEIVDEVRAESVARMNAIDEILKRHGF